MCWARFSAHRALIDSTRLNESPTSFTTSRIGSLPAQSSGLASILQGLQPNLPGQLSESAEPHFERVSRLELPYERLVIRCILPIALRSQLLYRRFDLFPFRQSTRIGMDGAGLGACAIICSPVGVGVR